MVDEATAAIVTDLFAWVLIAFWLFVWIGFLTSIILARIWIRSNSGNSKPLSSANSVAQSITNPAVAILPAATFPGVSILKPLTGNDETLSHNLESWFKLRYPLFEILLCVHDVDDPAVGVVNALIDKYPGVDAKLVISGGSVDVSSRHVSSCSAYKMPLSPTPSIDDVEKQKKLASSPNHHIQYQADLSTVINPKIRNILPAYESAMYDYLFISDCNIEAEPETLHDVVGLMGPGVGTVCQMHFVKDPPSGMLSFGSIVNKVFFGTQNAKAILFLALLRFTTTVSAAMLIRKSALEECGGLRAFGCYLAEDFHIGLALAKKGWKHKLGSRLAWQNPATTTVSDVLGRIIRWKRLRQTTNPFLVIVDPLSECVVLGVAASWALCHVLPQVPFWAVFLAHCLAWFFADFALLTTINKRSLNFPKFAFLLAWLVREVSAPFVHILSLLSRRVVWRGQEYYLRLGGQTDRLPSSYRQQSPPTLNDPLIARRRTSSLSSPPSLPFTPQLQLPVVHPVTEQDPPLEQPPPIVTQYNSIVNNKGSISPPLIPNSKGRPSKSRRNSQQTSSSPPPLCAVNA